MEQLRGSSMQVTTEPGSRTNIARSCTSRVMSLSPSPPWQKAKRKVVQLTTRPLSSMSMPSSAGNNRCQSPTRLQSRLPACPMHTCHAVADLPSSHSMIALVLNTVGVKAAADECEQQRSPPSSKLADKAMRSRSASRSCMFNSSLPPPK